MEVKPNTNRLWCLKKDVKTTMIYTHVLNYGPKGVRSPIDESKAVSYTDQSRTPAFYNDSALRKGGK